MSVAVMASGFPWLVTTWTCIWKRSGCVGQNHNKIRQITWNHEHQELFTLRFIRWLYNTPFVCLWIDSILLGSDTDGKHTTHQKLEVFSSTKLIGKRSKRDWTLKWWIIDSSWWLKGFPLPRCHADKKRTHFLAASSLTRKEHWSFGKFHKLNSWGSEFMEYASLIHGNLWNLHS